MPRIRTIKPEFFRSPSTAKVDFPVRIFYEAMWCWADDFGIGETNINGLLGFAFPDSDGFSAQDVRRFCADVALHYDVAFYIVRERHYYAIPSWPEHQKTERREDRRKHPPPDHPEAAPDLDFCASAEQLAQNVRKIRAGTGEQGTGEQGTGEQGELLSRASGASATPAKAKPPSKERGHRLPDGWQPSDELIRSIRDECPNLDLRAEHRRFVDYWIAVPGARGRKLDWNATWRNWMRKQEDQAPPRVNGHPVRPGADTKGAEWQALKGSRQPDE